MLTKCVNCGFYVRQADEYCLNCGKKYPTKSSYEPSNTEIFFYQIAQSKIFKVLLSLITTFLFVYYFANKTTINNPKFINFIWLAALLIWVLLFFIFFIFLSDWNFPNSIPRIIKNTNNLISKHKIIEKRISELNRRTQNIDTVLDKFKETESENLQAVRRKLLSAREIVMSQFARYELQRQKIELVRLQNGVSPYLFALHRLNEFDTENGLVTIENTNAEIVKIRQDLTRYDAYEAPPKTLPEKQNFLEQLNETEMSCKKLREALLSKQATRALQEISPITENIKLPSIHEITHTAETFNIQTTLTDFSESFEELEREYRRVQVESEISQNLLAD